MDTRRALLMSNYEVTAARALSVTDGINIQNKVIMIKQPSDRKRTQTENEENERQIKSLGGTKTSHDIWSTQNFTIYDIT